LCVILITTDSEDFSLWYNSYCLWRYYLFIYKLFLETMDGSDGLSGGETKDNADANETKAERTARLAGKDSAGAGPPGANPSTPIAQQNNVLTEAELAQHDADVLHDQLCTHLHGFMTATQSPELDTECYAALRGQTQGQLAALGDLLMQAGGLQSSMEMLNAERTAMHLDNTSLGQDMNEMADTNHRLLLEHAELRKEADSLRAAAVQAEEARTALAAATRFIGSSSRCWSNWTQAQPV
jgi:hypothetical protein